MRLEALEDRLAPAVLPPALVSGQTTIPNPGDPDDPLMRGFSPTLVQDPLNPSNLVEFHAGANGLLVGSYSLNGGQSWTGFLNTDPDPQNANLPNITDPNLATSGNIANPPPFTILTNPAAAWDRNGNIYVTAIQRDATNNSGALVFHRFFFSAGVSSTPQIASKVLERWLGTDPILNPTVAVDNNVPDFSADPDDNDTMVGKAVYIAWNTNQRAPTGPNTITNFNPNVIKVVASSDLGVNFTTPLFVNSGGNVAPALGDRYAAPQIVFTQGSTDGRVQGGQLVFVWNDFAHGTLRLDNTRPDGGVLATKVADSYTFTAGSVTGASSVTFISFGSGYTVGDVLSADPGATGVGVPTQVTVTSVDSGGTITGFTLSQGGVYTVQPTNPVTFTGGTGTGATANLTFSVVRFASNANVAAGGSGYAIGDILTASGGTQAGPVPTPAQVQVTSIRRSVLRAVLANTGSGYSVGDIVNVVGGTFTTPAQITVNTLGAGNSIATFTLSNAGSYTSPPANDVSVTVPASGGNGATFTLSFSATGAIAAVAIVQPGGSYTVAPTNPNTVTVNVTSAAVVNGGTGYNVGNILNVTGGTANTQARLRVDSVGAGGVITGVSVSTAGAYTVTPNNSVAVTGGSGTAATFDLNWSAIGVVVTAVRNFGSTGTGHAPGDVLTVVGGTATTAAQITVGTTGVNGEILTTSFTDVGAYTIAPTNPVTVTTSGTGIEARFNLTYSINVSSAVVGPAGANYVAGDILLVQGGTFTTQARIRVDTVTGGAINTFTVIEPGVYTVLPGTSAVNVTDITTPAGAGAQFTVTWGAAAGPLFFASTGSGYAANDFLDVVGGTGSPAQLRAGTVSAGGAILTMNATPIPLPGSYSTRPTNPVSVTDITAPTTGIGARFNLTYSTQATGATINFIMTSSSGTGAIADAIANPTSGQPDIPLTSTFSLPAGITDSAFVLGDLDVTVAITTPHLGHMRMVLISPSGTQITLINNSINNSGNGTGVGVPDAANMGVVNVNANAGFSSRIGTVFDQDAPRPINDGSAAAPYTAHFRPESGSLSVFNGQAGGSANLTGTWRLQITDNRFDNTNPPPFQRVDSWSLHFASGTNGFGNDQTLLTADDPAGDPTNNTIRGAASASTPYPLANTGPYGAPGVGPNVSVAVDNTVGAFSPYQGRIYIAYTGGSGTDTDVYLVTVDNLQSTGGGPSISAPIRVNDDSAADNFSEGTRPQFMPTVAVDPVTGTVGVMYYDGRWDPALRRAANSFSASIDGGGTFSQSVTFNTPKTAIDAITGTTINIEPVPGNQSQAGTIANTTFTVGFGDRAGLVMYGGHVVPVFSSNENRAGLEIKTARGTFAAGPRIISGDMGLVSGSTAPDGTPQFTGFTIQFDRPIDASSFTEDAVRIVYRDTLTSATFPGSTIPTSEYTVTPLDGSSSFGFLPGSIGLASRFRVSLTTPRSGIGTYSYSISPGLFSSNAIDVLWIDDDLVSPSTWITGAYNVTHVNMAGYNAITDLSPYEALYFSASTSGVGLPAPADTARVLTFVQNGGGLLLEASWGADITWAPAATTISTSSAGAGGTIPLTVAGQTHPVTASQSDPMSAQPHGFFTSFPVSMTNLASAGGGTDPVLLVDDTSFAGKLVYTTLHLAFHTEFPDGLELIRDAINWAAAPGGGPPTIVGIQDRMVNALSAATGNRMDQNQNTITGEGGSTTPQGDAFAIPAPLNGTAFALPYSQDTLPLLIPGPRVVSSNVPGGAGADNHVVNGTNSAINFTFDRDMDPASFTTANVLRIMGPAGPITTYQPGPSVTFSGGGGTGAAGIATISGGRVVAVAITNPGTGYTSAPSVSFIGGGGAAAQGTATIASGGVTGVIITNPGGNYSTTAAQAIPDNGTLNARLAVPDALMIKDLAVGVTITHPQASELTAVLIAPNGTQVQLFSGGTGANFTNTVFDQHSTTSIVAGTAPYTGVFRPAPGVTTALIVNRGSGYAVNDILTVQGGTFSTPAQLRVTAIGAGGIINAVAIVRGGAYSVQPANNVTVTGGAGTGATFTLTYGSGLDVLDGKSYQGTWTLRVTDSAGGNVGTLDSWTLNPISVTPVLQPNGTARTFRISFPTQELNGSYTIQVGPDAAGNYLKDTRLNSAIVVNGGSGYSVNDILTVQGGTFTSPAQLRVVQASGGAITRVALYNPGSYTFTARPTNPVSVTGGTGNGATFDLVWGNQVDTNINAGVDLMRGTGRPSNGVIVNNPYPTGALNTQLPAGQGVDSILNVSDAFVIESATISFNIQHDNIPDLKATLIGPDGTSVVLFDNVGNTGSIPHANFTNTTLDDTALFSIQQASTVPVTGIGPGPWTPRFPLGSFRDRGSFGNWTLRIQSNSATIDGTLVDWTLNLRSSVPGSGLGQPVADQFAVSFRIFTQDPTNPVAQDQWTAVGPAAIGTTRSGRIGGLAVDPSDPSGNTVYTAGASGGVWKTTNFFASGGPTWIPLTDFGPGFSINMGSIAVFGRNNDPNQSIIYVATGEGDTFTPGVGLLRSMDGGRTWQVLDSTVNVDSNGNILPIAHPGRDHLFVGMTTFRVVVDPTPQANGEALVYVGYFNRNGGAPGGVWRSNDSGDTWTLIRSGNGGVTDVVLAPASADDSGNRQILYAAFASEGVFFTSSAPTALSMTRRDGGQGVLVRRDTDVDPIVGVPVANPGVNPTGNDGRMVLAAPALTGNALQDKLYAGWLYCVVVTRAGRTEGLYQTKDFGLNWTELRIPVLYDDPADPTTATPTNNESLTDFDPLGNSTFAQGAYDVSLAVDPNNPNIVYFGGIGSGQPSDIKFIRVDATMVNDPYSLVAYDNSNNDGGTVQLASIGGVTVKTGGTSEATGDDLGPGEPYGIRSALGTPFFNQLRDPNNPFLTPASLPFQNVAQFTNNGTNTRWMPFADGNGGVDEHELVAMIDPLTGATRLIYGNDQGIWTGTDRGDGVPMNSIGGSSLPSGSRIGNLQITQLYYGAVQPSKLAEDLAAALFYGTAQDDGFPISPSGVLESGIIGTWSGPGGDWAGVATAQTGTGMSYSYAWPCCGASPLPSDFFFVDSAPNGGRQSAITGLLQPGDNPGPGGTGQWPFLGTINFAVNPIDPSAIVISSTAGRVFRTSGVLGFGQQWFPIADPGDLDGSQSLAMAFGAPSSLSSNVLSDFIYVGTNAGNAFVTFVGGGVGGGPTVWTDISNGLTGGSVGAIVANPQRGSREAFAVTNGGVFWMPDSGAAGATWQNITGNLFSQTLTRPLFNNPNDRTTTLEYLNAIQADWRYAIPDNFNNPNGPTHPVLYVGGEGGVFRSFDKGTTWTYFPDVASDGAVVDGGFFPAVEVNDLDFSIGDINPAEGSTFEPYGRNLLLATTYGRGSFAIRLTDTVRLSNGEQLHTYAVNPVAGPHVVSVSQNTPGSSSLTSIRVQFSGPVDPVTFKLSDVLNVFDPSGNPVAVSAVADVTGGNPHNVYVISLTTPQTTAGFYRLQLGPHISDYSGYEMDQDQDLVNGELTAATTGPLGALTNTSIDIYDGRFLFQPLTNSAPVLTSPAVFPAIDEESLPDADPTDDGSDLVSFLAANPGLITDADDVKYPSGVAPRGIAVTGVDNTNGVWEYSTDSGATWVDFNNPLSSNARLLEVVANNRIRFTPNPNFHGPATFTFRAWDLTDGLNVFGQDGGTDNTSPNGGTTAYSATNGTAAININPFNDPPINIVPGPQTAFEDTTLIFSTATSNAISISDVDDLGTGNETLQVTLTVNNGTLTLSGTTGLSFVFNDANGTGAGDGTDDASMTFRGPLANINAALNGLGYFPTGGNVTLTIVTNDLGNFGGGALTDTDTVAITTLPVNDAPLLDASASPALAPVPEDTASPAGSTVASIIVNGSITEVPGDNAPVEAIAVIAVDNTNGVWQFSTNGGTTWTPFGAPTVAAARLLAATNLIRFIPATNFNGNTATFTFRAWDMTDGAAAGTVADTSINGGTTAFSVTTDTANAIITPVNDAPVLNAGPTPTLTTIVEDANSAGDTVSTIVVDGSITETNPFDTLVEAIAVIGVDNTNGAWQFSTDGGGSWTVFGTPTVAAARLLGPANLIRFVPNANYHGSSSFSFRAWDMSSGTAGGTANTTTSGGITPFSTATDSASITITPVNDAPILNAAASPTLAAIVEDSPTIPAGNTVASIVVNGSITEVPLDNAPVEAIAVIGVDNTNGVWQFSTDGGGSWTSFGAPSIDAARLLGASDQIRFIPNPDFQGTVTFTFRAWDMTSGSAGSVADTTSNGGDTAFSLATDTAAITVTPINDAPTFTLAPSTSSNEDAGLQTVSGFASDISVGPPSESSQSLVAFILTPAGTTGGLTFTTAPSINVLTGTLTYQAAPNANGTATFDVVLTDNGPNTPPPNDNTSDSLSFTITVVAVNDAPSFIKGPDQIVPKNSPAQTVNGWATSISQDGGVPTHPSEQGQLLFITVNASNPGLFSVQPDIDASGNLTYTPAAGASGASSVTVQLQDNGGLDNGGSDTSTQTFNIYVTDGTTTTLSAPASSVIGESVTLSALVTSNNPTSLIPDGTVTFEDTTNSITLAANVPLNGAGQASIVITSLLLGSHIITATYSGQPGLTGSSDTATHQVNAASTSLSLSSSVGSFTAIVTVDSPGSAASVSPVGEVEFFNVTTGTVLAVVPLSNGQAQMSTFSLPFGDYTIRATFFSSNGNFTNSPPVTEQLTVSPNPLAFIAVPSSVKSGTPFTVVVFYMNNGVPDATFNGPISLAVNTGTPGGAVSGQTVVNASGGVATFSGIRIDRAGTYTLQASAAGLPAVVSSPIDITAAFLTAHVSPRRLRTNRPITMVLQALDITGQVAPNFNGPFVIKVVKKPVGARVLNRVGVFSGGVAVLNNLRLSKSGTYKLQITINGLTLTKTLVIRGRRSSST